MTQNKSIKKSGSSTFEQSLKRLEEIVEALEGGSVPLEEALNLYEEGVKISKECLDKLSKAEVRLKYLMKDVDGKISLADEIDEDE
jgi:exodeoxyribonuclease VII small subunit